MLKPKASWKEVFAAQWPVQNLQHCFVTLELRYYTVIDYYHYKLHFLCYIICVYVYWLYLVFGIPNKEPFILTEYYGMLRIQPIGMPKLLDWSLGYLQGLMSRPIEACTQIFRAF